MKNCCIQTQQATITKSSNIVDMFPNKQANGNHNNNESTSKTTCNGSNRIPTITTTAIAPTSPSPSCGNPACRVTISDEERVHIEQLLQTAYDFFTRTLQRYRVNQLIFCFNGGKDCTVLLDVLMRYCRIQGIGSKAIPMLYIESDDSFDEIDEFVTHCVRVYDVELIKYKDSLKQALTHMTQDMPQIKAVFVGSRNTDPYCEHLKPMQKTDKDWPEMMRLNPLLEWSYHDIWQYIHLYKVPYCSLYAQGYTSIGHKSNTLPNPHLRNSCVNGASVSDCYKPAWELTDPAMERAGRQAKK